MGAEISARDFPLRPNNPGAGYSGPLNLDNPSPSCNNYISGRGINNPPLLLPQVTRPTIDIHLELSQESHKISSLNPPKLLFFGESK
jgi:hypothetical protein